LPRKVLKALQLFRRRKRCRLDRHDPRALRAAHWRRRGRPRSSLRFHDGIPAQPQPGPS